MIEMLSLDVFVNLEYVLETKAKFCRQFDMTDMGALEHFSWISDTVNQIARVESELTDVDQNSMGNFPYRGLLGALLYLTTNTCPDIAYAVGLLSRFGLISIH